MSPYYQDDSVTLYLGDAFDVLAGMESGSVDCIVTDPPYGETSLEWDRWPDRWPTIVSDLTRSMWCFGSMRMFLDRRHEFMAAGWRLSQDVVWEKHNGSGFHADRFRRIHEHALHWYRGDWSAIHHETPTTATATARVVRSKRRPAHTGHIERTPYISVDGGPKLMESVIYSPSMHGRAIHPTEKPVAVLEPLIAYACPPGGTVLDPFAGSGSTGAAARNIGRRAVLIESREEAVRDDCPTSIRGTPRFRRARRMTTTPVALPPRGGHITHDPAFQCSVDGCILRYRVLGLCDTHYRQAKRREAAENAWNTPSRPGRRQPVRRGGITRWEAVA